MDNKDIKNIEESNNEEMALPSTKEETNGAVSLPEEAKTEEPAQAAAQTLNPQADFSTIFNVASEEQDEVPKESVAPKVEAATPTQVEVPVAEEKKAIPKFNKEQFNSEEKLLYEIKPEKEGNPIVVLLFFILLFSFIIFLPSISKKYDVFKFNNTGGGDTVEEEENPKYELGSTAVRVAIGNIELNNFVVTHVGDDNYLTFTLTNTSSQPYTFSKKYYIVLYEGETNRGYVLLHDYDIVAAYGAQEVSLIISDVAYNRADHFTIEEIEPNRYPVVNTTETDGEYDVLTCTYQHDEMKYYFSNNSLIKIKETYYEEQGSTANYEMNKSTYRDRSNKLKQIDGFDSTFIETLSNFTMINEIDLVNIQDKTLSDLQTYRYFKYSEAKNTVGFELQAQGYNCR